MVLLPGGEAAAGLAKVHVEVWVASADGRQTDQEGAIVTGGLVVEVLELTLLHEATHWRLRHQLLQVHVHHEVIPGSIQIYCFGVFFLDDRWR